MGFGFIQAANLVGWKGKTDSPVYLALCNALTELIGLEAASSSGASKASHQSITEPQNPEIRWSRQLTEKTGKIAVIMATLAILVWAVVPILWNKMEGSINSQAPNADIKVTNQYLVKEPQIQDSKAGPKLANKPLIKVPEMVEIPQPISTLNPSNQHKTCGNNAISIHAETQIFDDFNGVSVDETIWAYPIGDASFNGKTQMRPSFPNVSNGLLHLQLDTYNPTGNSFYGSEIFTQGKAPSGTGLLAEFKARLVTPVKGLVGGAFLYDIFSTGFHSEIDFELLSNNLDKVQTNIYANEPLGAGHPELNSAPQLDITQFNIYRIEWLPNKVRWFVNNSLVRETTKTIPQEQLRLFLNFYAPSCNWATACDANLQPASRQEDNKTYFFDIDWVRVCLWNPI